MLFISYSTNRLTGTDGFRLLSHQFLLSCLLLLATCLSRFKACWLTMKLLTSALLRWVANGVQDQNPRQMAFPLPTSRWSRIVLERPTEPFVQWQPPLVSPMKACAASCFMLTSPLNSQKRHAPQARISPCMSADGIAPRLRTKWAAFCKEKDMTTCFASLAPSFL